MKRLDFGHFVDRVFWLILTGIAFYASSQLKTMSESIDLLNEKMATIVERTANQEKHSDTLEKRVERLEERAGH